MRPVRSVEKGGRGEKGKGEMEREVEKGKEKRNLAAQGGKVQSCSVGGWGGALALPSSLSLGEASYLAWNCYMDQAVLGLSKIYLSTVPACWDGRCGPFEERPL